MKKPITLYHLSRAALCTLLICCMIGTANAASTKAVRLSTSTSATKTGSSKTGSTKMLSVPTPKASKGKYSGYVKVTWSKVSKASGYYIFRATSKSWSKAKRVKTISSRTTVSYKDKSASSSGKKYYYWVCPHDGKYYYYNTGKYAYGYRKKSSSSATLSVSSSSVTAGTRVYVYYKKGGTYRYPSNISFTYSASGVGKLYVYKNSQLSNNAFGYFETYKAGTLTVNAGGKSKSITVKKSSNGGGGGSGGYYIASSTGKALSSPRAMDVGQKATIYLYDASGKSVAATWLLSNGNLEGSAASVTGYAWQYTIWAMKPGTTVVTALPANGSGQYQITINIGQPGGSGGYSISGSTAIRCNEHPSYTLRYQGKKVSNVSWKVGGYLLKDYISAGVLHAKANGCPVSYYTGYVYAYVNGKKVASKSVKITK